MDKNYQYYNNRNKEVQQSCVYPDYRKDMFKYLLKENYLSDYNSEEDQYRVLYNLGILDRLELLKNLIDSKVIQAGGITWDSQPTSGNYDKVLSSDSVYKSLLKYYTKEEIDNITQTLWDTILQAVEEKIKVDSSLSLNSENPVQNKVITEALNKKIDKSNLEIIINELKDEIISELDQSESIRRLNDGLNTEINRATEEEQSLSKRIEELEKNPSQDSIKHIILTQEDYDKIDIPEHNVLYIIIESSESKFGDSFPFILK